jgi:tetratricopeptide (TPR) repeat protein
VAFAVAVSAVRPARAEPDATTRRAAIELAVDGMKRFDAQDYAGALAKLAAANQLLPAPSLTLHIGRCLEQLGRLCEAAAAYRTAVSFDLGPSAKAALRESQADARRELARLEPTIPTVSVTVRGDGAAEAEVLADGKRIGSAGPFTLDPGRHQLAARSGDRTVARAIELDRGQRVELVLELPPLPARPPVTEPQAPAPPDVPAPSPVWRVVGWSTVAAGGAAFAVGAATAVVGAVRQGDLESRCPERRCQPADWNDAEAFNQLRVVSGATLIAGAALAAAGTVIVLAAPGAAADPASAWLTVGPSAVNVRGVF